jgi:hypothetical protein
VELLPLVSLSTIMAAPLPRPIFDVEPLITRSSRVVLFGEFGSLKSWLLLNLALCLAAGRPWLDHFPVPKARPVLYVDLEMGERTLRRRLHQLMAGMQLANDLPLMTLSGVPLTFTGAQPAAFLQRVQEQFDPQIIIVESFRRVLLGSENEAKDVAAFWRAVDPIRLAKKTLILSHHMRKVSANPRARETNRDRSSGSTDVLAGADVALAVERLARPGGSVGVACVKARDVEEPPRFIVSLEVKGEDGPAVLRLREDGGAAGMASKLRQAQEGIVAHLTEVGGASSRADLLAGLSIQERTLDRALEQLAKAGRILQPERGIWQLREDAS